MLDRTNTKQVKMLKAASMLPESSAMKKMLPFSKERWAGILAELDEDQVDDLLLLLKEEEGMHLDLDKKEDRRLQVNETRYLQRLEKLRISMETLLNKNSENNG